MGRLDIMRCVALVAAAILGTMAKGSFVSVLMDADKFFGWLSGGSKNGD